MSGKELAMSTTIIVQGQQRRMAIGVVYIGVDTTTNNTTADEIYRTLTQDVEELKHRHSPNRRLQRSHRAPRRDMEGDKQKRK